jgi:fructose 1,6-bisphosphatase
MGSGAMATAMLVNKVHVNEPQRGTPFDWSKMLAWNSTTDVYRCAVRQHPECISQCTCQGKLYTIAGKEFGSKNEGRTVLIVRALYGLRSSGKSFQDYLAKHLREM